MEFTYAKNYHIRPTSGHSNITSKNVSWYHFSWATLYISKQLTQYLIVKYIGQSVRLCDPRKCPSNRQGVGVPESVSSYLNESQNAQQPMQLSTACCSHAIRL